MKNERDRCLCLSRARDWQANSPEGSRRRGPLLKSIPSNYTIFTPSSWSPCTLKTLTSKVNLLKKKKKKEFPCGPVLRTLSFHCWGAQVQSLVGELRSWKLRGAAKKRKRKKVNLFRLSSLHSQGRLMYLKNLSLLLMWHSEGYDTFHIIFLLICCLKLDRFMIPFIEIS